MRCKIRCHTTTRQPQTKLNTWDLPIILISFEGYHHLNLPSKWPHISPGSPLAPLEFTTHILYVYPSSYMTSHSLPSSPYALINALVPLWGQPTGNETEDLLNVLSRQENQPIMARLIIIRATYLHPSKYNYNPCWYFPSSDLASIAFWQKPPSSHPINCVEYLRQYLRRFSN